MKKFIVALFVVFLCGCLSSNKNEASGTSVVNSVADTAEFAANHLVNEIPSNAVILFSNTSKTEIELVDYAIEEISSQIVSSKKLQVAQRNENMESVMRELDFQMTGATSDETFAGIGHFAGAQFIVNCYMSGIGTFRHFSTMAVDVRTGLTQVQKPYPIIEIPNLTAGVATVPVKATPINPILENLVLAKPISNHLEFLAKDIGNNINDNESVKKITNPNIIVLDFITFEGNKRGGLGAYIADLITAELRQNENLVVLNRIGINAYIRDNNYGPIDTYSDQFINEIAKKMGADFVIIGNFRTSGNENIRITSNVMLPGTAEVVGMVGVTLPNKEFQELNMVMD